jgi:hypothetical protein
MKEDGFVVKCNVAKSVGYCGEGGELLLDKEFKRSGRRGYLRATT